MSTTPSIPPTCFPIIVTVASLRYIPDVYITLFCIINDLVLPLEQINDLVRPLEPVPPSEFVLTFRLCQYRFVHPFVAKNISILDQLLAFHSRLFSRVELRMLLSRILVERFAAVMMLSFKTPSFLLIHITLLALTLSHLPVGVKSQ